MRGSAICLLVLSLFVWVGFAAAQGTEREKAGTAATGKWLALVDSGNYGQSWKEAAQYFRDAVTEAKWAQTLEQVRDPLGKLVSREVKSAVNKTSLPGAPDGEYVLIEFQASFENKKSAIETVTSMLEKDGTWRIAGYFIK